MIAACPNCAARYRIDPAKLRPEGARLRCSRCETVFRVQPDAEAAAPPAAVTAAAAPRAAAPAAPPRAVPLARPLAPRGAPAPQPAGDPQKRVLIAHPEVEAGKAVADAVASWGLVPLLVHDGVEAMLQIQRTLPRVVVLDAALPKMFGFQICEIMKRNEQLRAIPVLLVGAIHDQDRYRRPPEELYGADAYLERHQLPDALAEQLGRFGIRPAAPVAAAPPAARPAAPAPARAMRPAPSVPASAPAPAPAAPAARAAVPTPPAAPEPAVSPELEKAQRLARIIVSDVILYNAEKFEAAVRAGDVMNALSAELEEGYSLFASRVDARVFDPREFLQRELVRVARSRGMK
ncbi:MAG TPA: zinc-ribbon domain-containing protein [Myxococcota bacterium]|nr:zinc-ribbon domain-containing protein [Myxococcota bacterium]